MAKTVRNTATAMLKKEYPACAYVIRDLIGEGLTLFGGKPKLGKSVFALNVAIAVASGGTYLGREVRKGVCAYLSLENGERTTANRLQEMIGRFGDSVDTDNLLIENQWEEKEPLKYLDNYLCENDDVSFVIVDTLMKFFSKIGTSYNDAYTQIEALRSISFAHDVPILVVDHMVKAESKNLVDMFSNSIGKPGAADNLMGLLYSKKYDAELHAMGRDVDTIIPLQKVPEYIFWDELKDTSEAKYAPILTSLKGKDGLFTPKDIARDTGLDAVYCRKMLSRWAREKRLVENVRHGQYRTI